jgi:threonine/homoserine/homoserine lactone efflux protein
MVTNMSLLQLLIDHNNELYLLTTLAIIMAISPGADFALVCRNTMSSSRVSGIYTTLGIATALWLHITYCIAGLALLISNSPAIFMSIKYMGAVYLVYLGAQSFILGTSIKRSKTSTRSLLSNRAALLSGFTSNALNPKTTLFFLGIFTQLVHTSTPVTLQLIYGAIICIAHIIWFALLSLLLSQQNFLRKVQRYEAIVNKGLGITLIFFALKIAYLYHLKNTLEATNFINNRIRASAVLIREFF